MLEFFLVVKLPFWWMGSGETTVVHPATANTAMIFMCWVKSSPNSSTSPFCMETHNKSKRWKYRLQSESLYLFSSQKDCWLESKYIKTTTIQKSSRLTTFPNQTSTPPQVAAGRTQIRPQHSQTWQGYVVHLISFAQKLKETLHRIKHTHTHITH